MNILTEAWGGKYQSQEISAKKGLNVDKLLEKVLLEADVLELKANPNKLASGAIIESSLTKVAVIWLRCLFRKELSVKVMSSLPEATTAV